MLGRLLCVVWLCVIMVWGVVMGDLWLGRCICYWCGVDSGVLCGVGYYYMFVLL